MTEVERSELKREAESMAAEIVKLRKFKAWVHAYLDEKGVPSEFPGGPHSKDGCRIGDRLDFVFAELEKAVAEVAASRNRLNIEREIGNG